VHFSRPTERSGNAPLIAEFTRDRFAFCKALKGFLVFAAVAVHCASATESIPDRLTRAYLTGDCLLLGETRSSLLKLAAHQVRVASIAQRIGDTMKIADLARDLFLLAKALEGVIVLP
jgi:hypothetical protein